MQKEELTQQQLKAVLDYNPETGEFAWLIRRKGIKRNKQPGCVRKDGYRMIRIDGHLYLAHRLAWLWVHGCWPKHDVDHINGSTSDNRIANLRDVPRQTNLENQRKAKPFSVTGMLGVTKHRENYYSARIQVGRKVFHLGTFRTPVEANLAYVEAKRKMHAGCTI